MSTVVLDGNEWEESHTTLEGEYFDGYSVGRLLGRGARGEVYVARRGRKKIALKVLADAPHGDIDAMARFCAAGKHPHIVAPGFVRSTRVNERRVRYHPMQLARGAALSRHAHRRRGRAWFLACLRAAARGLADMHRGGLVHGDVKPENLLLEPRAPHRSRWLDFDAVWPCGVDVNVIIGTPAYMAPERRRGEPPSSAEDVYSLGIMMSVLLLGVTAEEARGRTERFLRRSSDLPTCLAECIRRAVHHEPSERPSARHIAGVLMALEVGRACFAHCWPAWTGGQPSRSSSELARSRRSNHQRSPPPEGTQWEVG